MIGKGGMGPKTQAACKEHGCVYLHGVGGAAQVLAECIKRVRNVYFLEKFGSPEGTLSKMAGTRRNPARKPQIHRNPIETREIARYSSFNSDVDEKSAPSGLSSSAPIRLMPLRVPSKKRSK